MSKKAGVYLTETTQKVFDRYGENLSTSAAVNMIAERYWWAMKESLPQLTQDEWQALLNVYAGSEMSSYNPPYRIASDMMDDRGAIDIAELADADPDYAALVRKMHTLSQAEQCAVLDVCQRFWAGNWGRMESFQEILAELNK